MWAQSQEAAQVLIQLKSPREALVGCEDGSQADAKEASYLWGLFIDVSLLFYC